MLEFRAEAVAAPLIGVSIRAVSRLNSADGKKPKGTESRAMVRSAGSFDIELSWRCRSRR
jgi:hypothetical protein